MSLLHMFRARKYLQRILLSFMLVVIILIATSAVLYLNAQSKVLTMQLDADRKLLTQINFNIENMNGIIKDLAVSLFYDDDMVAVISGSDFEQSIMKLDKLNRTVATTPYLHSIVYYNGTQKRYFSSLHHDMNNYQLYDALSGYIKSRSELPKLQLIPVKLDESKEGAFDVFSFFVYDGATLNAADRNFLVLNIKPAWMLDNVEALNALAERENDLIFVTDSRHNVLISNDRMLPGLMEMKNNLLERISSSSNALDYFTYAYEGQKYRVTYLKRGLNDWQIISLQNYRAFSNNVSQMKWTAVVVTLSVVVMTVLLSVYFSIRLYKPIGNLLGLVRHGSNAAPLNRDEMSIITTSFAFMRDKLQELEQGQASQMNIAKVYHVRSLIAASGNVPEQEFRRNTDQYSLDIALQGSMVLALIRIDNLYDLTSKTQSTALSLLYFAISNIGQELLRRTFSCESADMKSDHLVFIISRDRDMHYDELYGVFREMQETVGSYYHITFSVTLSQVFHTYRDITPHYSQTIRHSNYRMILGKQAFIDPDRVKANEECGQFHIPQELERQLTEGLKAGDWEQLNDCVKRWLELVSGFRFENMFSALLHMVVTLSNTLGEIKHYNLNPVSINLQEINRRILEKETLEEIREVLMDEIREVLEKRQSGREDKVRLITETVKEIVDKHYSDPDINIQKIADMLHMRHVYLGQVFKERENETIVDYINRTRLAKAKLYLEQQDLTVIEIMEKVGFGNESYFYRLFKRQYGTTPKDYRLKHAIDRNN
ncbi:MAG: AraC family transcriptional regulator [Paenibacillaceae bacterium]|jgi:AraC-like DNA-binding protein|nr:AraC family transcriptional regulator [Paenibacillaceae bacterium]